MLRSDWQELSEKFGKNRRKDRQELVKYREDWKRLKSLLPDPGEILKPSEIRKLLEELRKLVLR